MKEPKEKEPAPEASGNNDTAELPESLRKFMEDVSRTADAWAKMAGAATAGEPSPLWSNGFFVETWLKKLLLAVDTYFDFCKAAEHLAEHYGKSNAVAARLAKSVLDNLDSALARFYSRIEPIVTVRGLFTHNSDLMLEATSAAKGSTEWAVKLIRRYEEMFPEDCRQPDGTILTESFPDLFAWDTYLRVAALDELANEFPNHVRTAAIQMNAWPMLRYPHHDNRARFEELAARLDLGSEYPLDATKNAKFRPDTPMVQYLDPLVCRLHRVWFVIQGEEPMSEPDLRKRALGLWGYAPPKVPDETVIEALQACCEMPRLTKATAPRWSRQVIVPMIMATDAQTATTCHERALQDIWRQKGVKSNATFKSRLLATVSATLKRMARSV